MNWIQMDVVYFLHIELLGENPFGVLCRLPETAFAIFSCVFAQGFPKNLGEVLVTVIGQLPSCEFSKIVKSMLETLSVKVSVE